MTSAEYRQALDALPYGKRLPGAVYLLDPGDDPNIPSLLRITVAELRRRLEIGPAFNLLKFHTTSPKISFLAQRPRRLLDWESLSRKLGLHRRKIPAPGTPLPHQNRPPPPLRHRHRPHYPTSHRASHRASHR